MTSARTVASYLCLWITLGSGIFFLHNRIVSLFAADRNAVPLALKSAAKRDWAESLKQFDRAINYRPGYAAYYAYRSGVKIRLGDLQGAMEDADTALRLGTSCDGASRAIAYLIKGEALLGLKRNKEAIEAFTKGIETQPYAETYYFRGWAWRHENNIAASDSDFAMAKKMGYKDTDLPFLATAKAAEEKYQRNLIPSPKELKAITLGFDRVLADLYWLNFVQYYGDRDAAVIDCFRQAPAYLNLIAELDPHFIQVYWFASFVMAGDLGLKKEAEEFLDRGIELNKEDWTVPYIAGFNQYLYNKNEKKAAEYYKIAAARPKAPAWLASQAKIFEEGIPSRMKKIKTWKKMYDQSKDAMVKQKALGMLVMLWSMVHRDAPNDVMRATAVKSLKELDAELIPPNQLPESD